MSEAVEQSPELTAEDDTILDRIWDQIDTEQKDEEPLNEPTILRLSDYLKADLTRKPDGSD